MDLTNDFLPKDFPAAIKEYICIFNCLELLKEALSDSDYKKANVMSENIARSFKELARLRENKLQMDKVKSFIVRLDIDLSKIEELGK